MLSRLELHYTNVHRFGTSAVCQRTVNAAWGQLISFTDYKAAYAGGLVAKVNPRGTSQECDCCGRVTPKTLNDRIHDCPGCGTVEDRDVHSGQVIKHRAFPWTKGAGAALEASSQRVAA
jgi:putative transposase